MTAPSVVQALSSVMADVQAVAKGDRNQQQNFNFRGIDAVVNAVGPALRKHGVVAVPVAVSPQFESYASRNGAQMRNTTLTVTWRFYGPGGDHIEAQSMGEASDAGDKSVTKAHSVAYRTLLLQALCIPTHEPDPDATVHERGTAPAVSGPSRDWFKEAGHLTDPDALRALYKECVAAGEMTEVLAKFINGQASRATPNADADPWASPA